jgi:hypothetical protein
MAEPRGLTVGQSDTRARRRSPLSNGLTQSQRASRSGIALAPLLADIGFQRTAAIGCDPCNELAKRGACASEMGCARDFLNGLTNGFRRQCRVDRGDAASCAASPQSRDESTRCARPRHLHAPAPRRGHAAPAFLLSDRAHPSAPGVRRITRAPFLSRTTGGGGSPAWCPRRYCPHGRGHHPSRSS